MSVPKRMRFEIFRRDGFRCRYCGATPEQAELRPDHVIPEALGGKTEPANLATACNDCNSGKSSIAPDSATVADVDERATRWAHALADAALNAERNLIAAEQRHDWFITEWSTFTNVMGRTHPIPAGWPSSLDAFAKAGLTQRLILDALHKAMRKPSCTDRYRYFCGICWSMATELAESAEAALAEPAQAEGYYLSDTESFAEEIMAIAAQHLGDDLVDTVMGDIYAERVDEDQQLLEGARRIVSAIAATAAVAEGLKAEAAPTP